MEAIPPRSYVTQSAYLSTLPQDIPSSPGTHSVFSVITPPFQHRMRPGNGEWCYFSPHKHRKKVEASLSHFPLLLTLLLNVCPWFPHLLNKLIQAKRSKRSLLFVYWVFVQWSIKPLIIRLHILWLQSKLKICCLKNKARNRLK